MADQEQLDHRRVHLVARNSIQSRCFLDMLGELIPATLHDELDDALSLVCLDAETRAALLIDVGYVDVDRVLDDLADTHFPPTVYSALLNVRRDADWSTESVTHGVRGLFYEDDSVDLVIRGVQALLDGAVWISRQTLLQAAVQPHRERSTNGGGHPGEDLTRREKEILGLICVGATNQEIADKLFISTNTVKTHIYKIYKKIDVPNRMQAALWGAKNL